MMLLKAAFAPPPRADPTQPGSRFALLPQQSEDDLALSEVHSKLDRALNFLQRDVGYSLLDDAQPESGGGVRLRQGGPGASATAILGGHAGPGTAPLPRGARSCRLPKEKLPEPAEPAEAAGPDEVLCCSPEIGKYAHYKDDIVLVWRFASLIHGSDDGVEQPIERVSGKNGTDKAGEKGKGSHDILYKKVLQGVRLMHLCDYHYADVVLTLAYASVYFRSAFVSIGHKMSDYEAAHVCVLLIYLAHSFLLDETCPLRVWQQHIFKKYCNLKVLDAALFRIFQMRGFKLRITEEDEREALSVLLRRANGCHVRLSNCMTVDGGDANGSQARRRRSRGLSAGSDGSGMNGHSARSHVSTTVNAAAGEGAGRSQASSKTQSPPHGAENAGA
eukprot:gb/GFBE01003601.1/.p1 GENE.gb/GFBE01003601.1/~~gb/GFBE01003601.1/.p1  ORF type:complete len:389 (+),score=48.12 gb/GFBE01003601.1/:1-1167(+)